MIASICARISKLPVCSNIANLLYKALHKTMCDTVPLTAVEAEQRLAGVYTKPNGTVAWNRNAKAPCRDISVIIPFYKTEQYAVRCIESVLTQQVSCSMEVILVDDGSPDQCGEILDSYEDRENVVVIHQKNAGLSAARNTGLRNASGEYVLFVDSDDYLLPGAIQTLMDCARKYDADIVEGSHQTFTNRGVQKNYCHEFEVATGGAKMFGFAWGKVYRAALFDEICYPVGYWYEDTITHACINPRARTTVCLPSIVYGYFLNQKGISAQTKTNIKCIDTFSIINMIFDYYAKTEQEIPTWLRSGTMNQLGDFLFFRTKGLDRELQTAVFVLAADMVERYNIQPSPSADYYENEIYLALKNRQYKRWKWASILG